MQREGGLVDCASRVNCKLTTDSGAEASNACERQIHQYLPLLTAPIFPLVRGLDVLLLNMV